MGNAGSLNAGALLSWKGALVIDSIRRSAPAVLDLPEARTTSRTSMMNRTGSDGRSGVARVSARSACLIAGQVVGVAEL